MHLLCCVPSGKDGGPTCGCTRATSHNHTRNDKHERVSHLSNVPTCSFSAPIEQPMVASNVSVRPRRSHSIGASAISLRVFLPFSWVTHPMSAIIPDPLPPLRTGISPSFEPYQISVISFSGSKFFRHSSRDRQQENGNENPDKSYLHTRTSS